MRELYKKNRQEIDRALQSVDKEFTLALKNIQFQTLVSKFSMPREYLAKYTSKFQMSIQEQSNCHGCRGLVCCKNQIPGHVYYPVDNHGKLVFSYVVCSYEKEKLEQQKHYKNILLFDEPKEMKEARLCDISLDDKKRIPAIKWITAFPKKYTQEQYRKGLYLHGSFGGGKSFLVAALMNEMASLGYRVAMVYYPEFLRALKGAFEDNFNTKFDQIKKCDILLLDDIGAETTTSWNRDEILGAILQYRMQENLPTFFTSNLTLEELENHFQMNASSEEKVKARRIMERIKQLSEEMLMISENRRD